MAIRSGLLKRCVLVAVFCIHMRLVSPATINVVVTPLIDFTVPITFNENITFDCAVTNGNQPEWSVNTFQLVNPSDMIARQFAESGISIEIISSNVTRLIITPTGRTNILTRAGVSLNTIVNSCTGIRTTPDGGLERGDQTFTVSVTTYARPDPPVNLDLISSVSGLTLVWERPANAPPQVATNYTVTISSVMPNNISQYGQYPVNTTPSFSIHFLEESLAGMPCQEFQFAVVAANDAGIGESAIYNDTVPISANTSDIDATLSLVSLALGADNNVSLTIEFKTIQSCSENFPILDYTINLNSFPARVVQASQLGSQVLTRVVLNSTDSMVSLVHNSFYSLSVTVRSEVSERESRRILFRTTDVQSASAVFYENNVLLRCVFANSSESVGCLFRLSPNSNGTDVEEFFLPRDNNEMILSLCNSTVNQLSAYTRRIGVFDVENDESVGVFRVRPTEEEFFDSANFSMQTGCELDIPTDIIPIVPVQVNVAAIVVPIVVVLLLAAAVITAVLIGVWCVKRRHYKDKLATSRSYHSRIEEELKEEKKKSTRKTSLTVQPDGYYSATVNTGGVFGDNEKRHSQNGSVASPVSINLREPTPSIGSTTSASGTTPTDAAGGPPMLDVGSTASSTSYSPPRTKKIRPAVNRSYSEGAEPLLSEHEESGSKHPVQLVFGLDSVEIKVKKAQLLEELRIARKGLKKRSRSVGQEMSSHKDEETPLIPSNLSEVQFRVDLLNAISEEHLDTVGEESGTFTVSGTQEEAVNPSFQLGNSPKSEHGAGIPMKDVAPLTVAGVVNEESEL